MTWSENPQKVASPPGNSSVSDRGTGLKFEHWTYCDYRPLELEWDTLWDGDNLGTRDLRGAGIILWMCPANERRRYIVMLSLIGWAHIQNDPWGRKGSVFGRLSLAVMIFTWHTFFCELIIEINLDHSYSFIGGEIRHECLWSEKKLPEKHGWVRNFDKIFFS